MSEDQKEKEVKGVKKFESLSPKPVDSDSVKVYLEALKEGLDDIAVKNIALTGSYGSGKSSILRSFEKDYGTEYNFLNISLAEFDWEDDLNPPKSKDKDFTKLVELSILQQIFYKVRPKDVPDSKLKRIINISEGRSIGISVSIVVWFCAFYALLEFNYLESLNTSNWSMSRSFDWTAMLFFLITVLGLFLFFKKAVRWLLNTRINKLNLKGVELGRGIEESILNKHLNEILYFFERTPYNVLVIEDLDRQNELGIFTKLREINYLLNNSEQVISKKRRKITFIYAVRDGILKEKERTKFFDFVIPVIPFINSYNSNEKLRERLLTKANKSLAHPLTEEFIDDVSLYIDDMRLLLSICNEYEIYKANLNPALKQNNILALVIYKNMRPKDFDELHNRRGKLFSLLSRERKSRIISHALDSIKDEQQSLEQVLANIESEKLMSIGEVNAVYLHYIRRHVAVNHIPHSIKIKDEKITLEELENGEYFKDIDKSATIAYTYQFGSYNGNTGVTFDSIEKEVPSELNYEQRISSLSDRFAERQEAIKRDIEALKLKKSKVGNLSLESIFNWFNQTDFLAGDESEDKLMIYLLRNGYIDENYQSYISYFHKVSLSVEDNEYLICVTSETPLRHTFELKNIGNVVKRIQPRYFEKKAILNFDLLSYLLKNKEDYPVKVETFLTYLTADIDNKEEAREKFNFIFSYLEIYPLENEKSVYKGGTKILLDEICQRWVNWWGFIKHNSGKNTSEDLEILLKYILSVVELDKIKLLDKHGDLKKYIEGLPNFLTFPLEKYIQKFGDVIQALNIKFAKIDSPDQGTKKLFDYVYEHNHYALNDHNISTMMAEYGGLENDEAKSRYNYTAISNSSCVNLKNYIDDEINEYLKYVDSFDSAYADESENSIIEIYNNKRLEEKLQRAFLEKQTVLVSDISRIDNKEKHKEFFELSRVVANWSNISFYYSNQENTLGAILTNYLNKENNYLSLSDSKIEAFPGNENEQLVKSLSISLITCNGLSILSYVMLLASIPVEHSRWKSISFENIDDDKVLYLIENNFLTFSESNHNKIYEGYSSLLIDYLAVHQNNFVAKYDDNIYLIDLNQKEGFFNSRKIYPINKIKLFQKLEKVDVISNRGLSSAICAVLSEHSYTGLDYEYLQGFFTHSSSLEDRIKLFNLNSGSLNTAQMVSLISELPEPYNKIAEKQNRPRIKKTVLNVEFVEILKGKRFISSYKVLDSFIRIVARY